ncbi:MAG: hypothetical protein HY332_24615 [Chloroflexi bacterium]|nr:hypothetical protein [Chloroflexota bacterium]
MKLTTERALVRRGSMFAAAAAATFTGLVRPFTRTAYAQKASLLAKQVGKAPDDPDDPAWDGSDVLEVPLAPQAVAKPRTYNAGVASLRVRSLHDDSRLAFLVEWSDAAKEVSIGSVSAFRDAVAVEFPADPAAKMPYFAMGEPNNPVTIYHWKADWQFARDRDMDEKFPLMAADWYPFTTRGPGEIAQAADYAKQGADNAFLTSYAAGSLLANPTLQARTPVEKLQAEGFGTLEPVDDDKQDGLGKGAWKDGVWRTVISLPRTQERFTFARGKTYPVAFAAWDGAKQERGGEKGISTWYFLSLEQRVGPFAYINPVLAVGGAVIAQIVGLRMLRRRRG